MLTLIRANWRTVSTALLLATFAGTVGLCLYQHFAGSCCRAVTRRNADTATTDTGPIACRLDALTATERAREGELLHAQMGAVEEVRELPDGYAYRFAASDGLFRQTAERITLEHRCCPFLSFSLEWAGDSVPWLHVTGRDGAKEFLEATFGAARAG